MLPIASSARQFTTPVDALFTATSAVCVTGLVVLDTGTHWSTFGQTVLLVLFQIGGLGFMTGATIILAAIGRGLGLREKVVMTESFGLKSPGYIAALVKRLTVYSLIIESIGAAIFYFHWQLNGAAQYSLFTAVFHSVSAFNNCGMDLFSNFKSLISQQSDAIFLLTTAVLIILGGLGFLVVEDIFRKKKFNKLSLESKVVLRTTLGLIVCGTVYFFIAEYSSAGTLGPLTIPEKIVVAFFQAVTPRTAGFSAIDINNLKEVSLFFTMFLMFVGGATGSAAGGIKVNTFGLLIIIAISYLRGSERVEAFGRELTIQNVHRAIVLVLFFIVSIGVTVLLLSITETFKFDAILFEAFSAFGTVGLSTGISTGLSRAGRIIIIIAMFIGRLGPLTLFAIATGRRIPVDKGYPSESIRIG